MNPPDQTMRQQERIVPLRHQSASQIRRRQETPNDGSDGDASISGHHRDPLFIRTDGILIA
ncbi:MAG: hypothetical protein AAGG48_21355 [Planctomycetota bacterium]